MFRFCKKHSFNASQHEKKNWLEALGVWIEAGRRGEMGRAVGMAELRARNNFRRLTSIVFGDFTVDEVADHTFLAFATGGEEAAALKGVTLPKREENRNTEQFGCRGAFKIALLCAIKIALIIYD